MFCKKSCAYLVLTERKTLFELVFKIKDKTANSVRKVWDYLECKHKSDFKNIFKTVTNDNGSEFLNTAFIEQSCLNLKKQRLQVFYCHPYSSFERGSNENQNKLIRRFYPKGIDFNKATKQEVKQMQNWINNYPRKKFDGLSAFDMVGKEIQLKATFLAV